MKKILLCSVCLTFICCIYMYTNTGFLFSDSNKNVNPDKSLEQQDMKELSSSILVEECNDGDTCKVLVAGLRIYVRLAEIDAPEIAKKKSQVSQPFSQQAKDRLNQLVRNKYVKLEQVSLDRYNRPIVKMTEISSGVDVNLKLVEEGLAELYVGGRKNQLKNSKYVQAQFQAKKQKLGIWSLSNYLSPYDYRRLNSKSNSN